MKIAIYSRKSKFSEKGESIENQIEMCKSYIINNISKDASFKIYEDEGFSGGNIQRPQFKQLIEDAKSKKFDILVCYKLDRISRNVADFSQTIDLLEKFDIKFISITEQFDTTKPLGRAMMNISATFAQLERETIAERIKDNMLELSKTGRWLGGYTPLGYKSEPVETSNKVGKSKKYYTLKINDEQSELVKLIFKLYLQRRGYSGVANELCRLNYKGRNGGELTRQSIKNIITNPVYAPCDEKIINYFKSRGALIHATPSSLGTMVYNKTNSKREQKPIDEWIIANGEHEPLVTSDVWLKCIELNNKHAIAPKRSGTGKHYLLSGLLICGYCYSSMSSWSSKTKAGVRQRYYRCNLKNRAANRCCNTMLNAEKAEVALLNKLEVLSKEDIIKNFNSMKAKVNNKNIKENEKNKLENKLDKNNKTISGIIQKMALLEDDIEILEMFKTELNALKEENKKIKYDISNLDNEIEQTDEIRYTADEIWELVSKFNKLKNVLSTEQLRTLLNSFIDNIIWYGKEEILEVNLIYSGNTPPPGTINRRYLCNSKQSRYTKDNNTIETNTLNLNVKSGKVAKQKD